MQSPFRSGPGPTRRLPPRSDRLPIMLVELQDKVVLVTGAGRGIGRAIAEAFVRERAVVVGLDVGAGATDWLDQARGGAGLDGGSYPCDVRDSTAVNEVVGRVVKRFGRIDVLVNNAGIMGEGLIEDLDDES